MIPNTCLSASIARYVGCAGGSRQLTRGLFKEAYGADAFRPKHHYALHLPLQMYRHGFLVATMTMERKHRVVKRYLRPRRTLTSFELGIIEEITCFELWQLCDTEVAQRATLADDIGGGVVQRA